MKYFKVNVIVFFLSVLLFQVNMAAAQSNDVNSMSIDEIAYQMTIRYPSPKFIDDVVNKSNKEPEFRKELVENISEGLSTATANNKMGSIIRALRELNVTETVMELIKIWNETDKKVELLESGDKRIHLLTAIAQFLPEGERVLFLIKAESDETEDPIVRFRANILLCATGNQKAIDYIVSAYEGAKKKFPIYLTMSPEQERNSNPWVTESDKNGDGLSSYIERGLLLDPNNIDTDGDGLRDGNDRNPLCKTPSPFDFNLWLISPYDYMDGTEKTSLFANLQFSGIDGIVLQLSNEQFGEFQKIHGYSTCIGIHKISSDEEQKDTKQFILTISSDGNFRSYNVTFKHFSNIWLPVSWDMGEIT